MTLPLLPSPSLVNDWLEQKHCTLWMNWDITDADERAKAVEWFLTTVQEYVRFTT